MFGNSSPKESENEQEPNVASPPSPSSTTEASLSPTNSENKNNSSGSIEDMAGSEKRTGTSPGRTGTDKPSTADKKRRSSSGVQSKASSFLASAKNSLLFSPHPNSVVNAKGNEQNMQTPLQKLGKQDPALSVPQGQHNNSAGESLPGPRSTFRVGVWEDKNKKCRRTMEDTHAFLYNFLSTPAPAIKSDKESLASEESKKPTEEAGTGSDPAQVSSSSDIMETDNGYFAIFDGHAGTFAADWCGKKLHIILQDFIRKNPNSPIPEMFDQTYTNVDSQLEKLPLKNSGCTAVTAVLRWEDRIPNAQSATGSSAIAPATAAAVKAAEEALKAEEKASEAGTDAAKAASPQTNSTSAEAAHAKLKSTATRQRVLYTANVGDARIVLCRNGKALRLSYDHKGSDENEGKRVANAGGLILNNRVNGVLAVTRALGDAYMKDLVTGHPYTTETVIQPDLDEFIILACDGLWDVCSDQDAVDLVRNIQDPVVASKTLVDHALARFSTDNLSCMIVRFNKNAILESATTPIGVEGDEMMGGTISETDKIVGEATRRSKEGGQSVGVSGSNSGKGVEPKSIVMNATTGEQVEERSGISSMESVAEEEGEGDKAKSGTEG